MIYNIAVYNDSVYNLLIININNFVMINEL
jgi:hypothetical protein